MTDSNKLVIEIKKPVKDVYLFTVDPANTHKWIESLVEEQADVFPPKVGTQYKNCNRAGEWSFYVVSCVEENKLFELLSADGKYGVRYTYEALPEAATRLEYLEWVTEGKLESPFSQLVMERLKSVIESA